MDKLFLRLANIFTNCNTIFSTVYELDRKINHQIRPKFFSPWYIEIYYDVIYVRDHNKGARPSKLWMEYDDRFIIE